MDIAQTIIIVAATVVIQSLVFMALANRFLKFAFDKVGELFIQPTVAKAFGILGGKSGESRRNKALENEIGESVLSATIGKYKPILGLIGVDLDDMLSKYTPMEVLSSVQTFMPMLQSMGINIGDLSKIVTGATGQQPPQSSNMDIK